MTRTIVASATREIVIGFDQPFCVIGERINPTGRKKLAAEMVAGNFETVRRDALAQVAAGALVLDVNAGVTAVNPNETEPPLLVETQKIVERAADHGIKANDIVVDPLVMPIGAMGSAGRQVFTLVRRLREELKVNTTCGASNVSFGLPNRNGLNGTFLAMAIANGMTSAITSPLHEEVRQAVMAADVMMGNDRDCAAWIN